MNIRKTIIALGSACMLFVVSPAQAFRAGAHFGGAYSTLGGFKEVKMGGEEAESSYKLFPTGNAYVSTAFAEYFGIKGSVNYNGVGGVFTQKKELGEIAELFSHNISGQLAFQFYPLGYDPEEGVLNIDLGVQATFPVSASMKGGTKVAKDSKDKVKLEADKDFGRKDFNLVSFDAVGGVGYEFANGVSIEAQYNHGFTSILKKAEDKDVSNLEESLNL